MAGQLTPRRIALGVGVVLLLFLVATQVFLPNAVSNKIESRLTRDGGTADVSVKAWPAARLLFGDGSDLKIKGSGLSLELSTNQHPLRKLDGFSSVDVALDQLQAGPATVDTLQLTKSGSDPYHLVSHSSVSLADIAAYAAVALGAPPIVTGVAAGSLPKDAQKQIPIDMDMQFTSDDGRVKVSSGGAEINGIPTGPLAQLLTSVISVQL
jgi:hypothetical protein